MANLGNLWFGSDIDLTNLKKKIEQGNREVLEALKLKYDAKSYTEMTSRLRNDLSKEVFDIKINSNVDSLKKSLNSALGANVSLGKGFTVQGIDAMRLKSIQLERILADTNADITQMQRKLDAVKSAMGSNTLEAKRMKEEILAAKQSRSEDAYAVKQCCDLH